MRSRMFFLTALTALTALTVLCAPISMAQEASDTLAQRLEHVERLLEILRVQVAEQAGTKVAPRSGNLVELSGIVLLNAFSNSGKAFMDDVPQFVLAPDPLAANPYRGSGGASAAVRQTRLTLTAAVENVMGAQLTTELDFDFFGGQHPSSGGRTFTNLRIRRTRAELQWTNVTLMFGQEAPPIVEINPASIAAMGCPGFAGAGNLWLWLPQARLRVHTSGQIKLGLEVAALAPTDGTKRTEHFYNEPDRAEKSRRPFLQSRLVASWGGEDTPGELSLGGHAGWFATAGDSLLQTNALAASTRFFLSRFVEIRGEAFRGQALRGLGGGGVYQNFNAIGVPLDTKGGWVQLNILPSVAWEFGGGFGVDDPKNTVLLFDPERAKNFQWESHAIWRPFPLVFSFEYRRMETTYSDPAVGIMTNNHFNFAAGFEF